MSLDYQTYLGPYFVCKVKQVKRTETYRGCVNPECKQYRLYEGKINGELVKFCWVCGRPMGYCEVEVEKDDIDPEDVREAVKERLCLANGDGLRGYMHEWGVHMWLGNIRTDLVGNKINPVEDCLVLDFLPNDIPEQMNRLIGYYSDEFVTLKRLYGADNVSVKWGLINQIW